MRVSDWRTNRKTGQRYRSGLESAEEHAQRVLAESGFTICPYCNTPILTTDYPAHEAAEVAKAEFEKTRTQRYGQGTSIDDYERKL